MKNRGRNILCMLFGLLFLALPFGTLTAQTADNSMAIGLGLGATQIPAEGDFSADGMPVDIFFDWDLDKDWLKFRVGYNTMQKSTFEYDKYNKTIENTLSSSALYAAYRYTHELMTDLELFGIGGLSMISSKLEVEYGGASADETGSTISYVLGGGAFYFFGSFGVGAQVNIFGGEVDFDGAELAVGSTQLQISANYGF